MRRWQGTEPDFLRFGALLLSMRPGSIMTLQVPDAGVCLTDFSHYSSMPDWNPF